MRKTLLGTFLLFFYCFSVAQAPPGYYNNAEGKTGTELQSALHNIIKGHQSVSYSSLPTYFQSTDKKANGTVWDMYSDIPGSNPPYVFNFGQDECGNYNSEGDCYNREHSWPKSWFGGEVMPMYSDLFHLVPTDGYVNNRRDNYPYGEVGTASWTSQNGCKLGSCITPGYSGTVFEPIDEYKGDFARNYFYMSTRYYGEDAGWPGSGMTTGSQLKSWALNMMIIWNSEDPVSEKETDRNDAVYEIQDNRNPFIDHPEFAGLIWSFPSATNDFDFATVTVYPLPAEDHCFVILPGDVRSDAGYITVTGISGSTCKVSAEVSAGNLKLDISDLPAGMWILSLINQGRVYHGKIVKK